MKLLLVAVSSELLDYVLGAWLANHLEIFEGVCGQVAVRYAGIAILLHAYQFFFESCSF